VGVRGETTNMNIASVGALVFDVDGTLYRQGPVRLRLAAHCLSNPMTGVRTLRLVHAYRRQQEDLREAGSPADQLRLACRRVGVDPAWGTTCVETWIHTRPLDLVGRAIYPGLIAFLKRAVQRGMALAVVSDYPAERKLRSLGLQEFFPCVVAGADPRVGKFKPAPDGILAALEDLHVAPGEALYIGDRPEVDGEAARRAGVACAIVDSMGRGEGWFGVRDYNALGRLLESNR
jgi:beta-phosphoglucomutase-like phosphatase (HAD superfamily)